MGKKGCGKPGRDAGYAAKARFSMVKDRHRQTYEAALSQGKVDEQMQSLCSYIAGTGGFFTSSCCSGRIILLEKRGERKSENHFHRKWHREIAEKEMLEGLAEPVHGELWFKLDPFILHIGCATLADANKVLAAMKRAGVKRGGILVAGEGKFLIELQGTENMGFLAGSGGKSAIGENYLRTILPRANLMLRKNYARLERLEKEFRKALK